MLLTVVGVCAPLVFLKGLSQVIFLVSWDLHKQGPAQASVVNVQCAR